MTAHHTRWPRRLAAFSERHHWTALAAWFVVLIAVTAASSTIGDEYRNDFSMPGTQSQELMDLLEEHGGTADSTTVVLHDERGWDTEQPAIDSLIADLGQQAHVASVTPADPQQGTVSEDGTTAMVTVNYDAELADIPGDDHAELLESAQDHASGDLQIEVSGEGIREVQENEAGGGAEGAGMIAALVILVFMFGSLLAASLPLITAVFAVGTTFGAVALLSRLTTIPDYTAPMLMLVGLGVGIDYALLIFSRYRSELLRGADRPTATATALDSAGRSVLFAGISVIVALLGLYVLGISALQGVVLGVVLTVAMTMLASLTLLPSLLTVFGRRIERRVRKHAAKARSEHGHRWRSWARLVQRRPWPALLVAVGALVALAVPALGMNLGMNDAGNDHESTTTRAAYDLVSEKFGPGANGPLFVVTEGTEQEADRAFQLVSDHAGVAETSPPRPLDDDLYLMIATPGTGPQDAATSDLVEDLRDDLGDSHLVGGPTAAGVDFSSAIADRFPLFVALVVGVSAVLLIMVFRSIPIALKAAALNLLSIGAALGAMTLVFQDGRFGVPSGPIEAFLPVMMFAIVFGLSMDYEVFLMSRMHEEWTRTQDAARAVREGLANTGGVITAAAAIMIVVFGAFVLSPDRMLQQMGFGMAVAVLLDAVVIRCLIVPAVMRLLGDRAWWAPRWVRRSVPTVRVE